MVTELERPAQGVYREFEDSLDPISKNMEEIKKKKINVSKHYVV